jgi:hypothetical protein
VCGKCPPEKSAFFAKTFTFSDMGVGLAKDDAAPSSYAKFGFRSLKDDRLHMFLPMETHGRRSVRRESSYQWLAPVVQCFPRAGAVLSSAVGRLRRTNCQHSA